MKKILVIALAVILALPAVSQPVSETVARRQAQAFLQQRGKSLASGSRLRTSVRGRRAAAKDSHSSYYVFNVADGEGFVIVSGDSRTTPILGYADQGSIASDDMPDGLRFLLDIYAEELAALDNADVSPAASRRAASATHHAIAPFVVTHWNQSAPYNNYCPTIDGERAVTGCVATAMAQVMYHHRWPEGAITAIPGYTTRNGKCTVAELPATTIDWTAMTATYSTVLSGSPAETAVATLMQYCGSSLQMNYNVRSAGGSSAYNASIAEVLKSYFGYDATYAQRQHYTYAEWVDMVYGELSDGRPVVLGGQAVGGGHSFVCDGYDTDDYFHINWGWGGSSDGYFRLSVLDPYEQGIGGSSSLDGFSFTQDAVVGIAPRSADAAPACLSLEKLQFDATGTTATQTVTRESADEAFTGLPLYVSLCNYSYTTAAYDYEILLTDGATTTVLDGFPVENQSFTFNSNKNLTLSLSTPAALADGTYTVKVLSRANGQTAWQECYDGPQQQLTAVVDGNTMTVSAPIVSGTATVPTDVVFTVSGNQTKGYEQTVTASVTGGAVDYYGNLVLRVNGTAVMGKSVEIPAGATVDVHFSYIPTASGNNTLTLYDAKTGGKQIGSVQTIAIAESDATNDLDLNFSYTIDNQTAGGQLYGNAFRATITVSNPSLTSTYVGQLNCSARQWTKTEETVGDVTTTPWGWESLGVTHYPLTVEKNGSTVVHVAADDLPAEGYYSFRLTYQRVAGDETVADAVHVGLVNDGIEHGSLTISDGYRLGDATGAVTIHEPSATINAADACFADLRGLFTLAGVSVTPSSNPNCLYLLPEGASVPDGLSGLNVVSGTTAPSLALTDGHDFYSPISFTADAASYTRTFTQPAAGTSGWTTLMLPFTATTVTVLSGSPAEKRWFRSDDDEDGSFWLRAFTADAEGTVTFSHAQELAANTPYIIAVPGDTWGDEWQMTGRPVTFSAANATISATAANALTGSHYKFCGTTATTAVTDAYVLNDRGSRFVLTADAQEPVAIAPFRAWFEPISISSLTLPALAIGSGATSGVRSAGCDTGATSRSGWYTLDGRRLSAAPTVPGLYIYNGQAIIIK
ncbi:MAG: C10 family peptidase [Prevotella sp.]|nr:C10 family peptidase [Prevotella sp.]